MSDAKEAFRLGFLTRCAEEGLTAPALNERLEKVAGFVGDIGRAAGGLAGLPIAAGLLTGGALGYGAAKLTAPKLDEDEMKSQELIHTYKVLADRARAKRKMRSYRPSR